MINEQFKLNLVESKIQQKLIPFPSLLIDAVKPVPESPLRKDKHEI